MTAMQKLLWPDQTRRIATAGLDAVFGPVVRLDDAAALRTPVAMLEAYGLGEWAPYGEDPAFVDVLRFETTPLTTLSAPEPAPAHVPWPTYATGFLPAAGAIVPLWRLTHTRVPTGAEVWRLHATGQREPLVAYAGPAFGWKGVDAYVAPEQFIGPRAVWKDLELPAAFLPDDHEQVELVALGPSGPEGFEQVRPQVWRRVVPVAACTRVFELLLTCRWRGQPARVLQSVGDRAVLLVEAHDVGWAERARDEESVDMLEPGIWRAVVAISELEDSGGSTIELPRRR